MAYGIRLRVAGKHALFTRPEMKVERVSYDVITPSAARGLLEAIHWKPAIRWVVDAVHVLAPIRFQSIRRNEVASKVPVTNIRGAMKAGDIAGLELRADQDRQQRAATVLVDVDYVLEAHFEMTVWAGQDDNVAKHLACSTPATGRSGRFVPIAEGDLRSAVQLSAPAIKAGEAGSPPTVR